MAKRYGAFTHPPIVERVEIQRAYDMWLNRREAITSYRVYAPVIPESHVSFDPEEPISVLGPALNVKTYEVREHVTRVWRCKCVEMDSVTPKIVEYGFYENYHAFVLVDVATGEPMEKMD